MVPTKTFKAGDGVLTSFHDGQLELGAEMFSGMTDADVSACLAEIGQADGPVVGSLNAYVFENGSQKILIDSGGGEAIPSTGQLVKGMEKAGMSPDDIDLVLCTHLHPDHIGGLMKDGRAVFEKAEIKLHQKEIEFWSNPLNRANAPEMFHDFFDLANAVLAAYRDQISTFTGACDVATGVQAVPLPGHTPGHTGFQIGDGDDGLLIWGDIIHVQAFQMPHPMASIAFDVDADMAIKTRETMFERAAGDRQRIAGMHLASPGVGYVVERSQGYWFEPD